MKRQMSDTLRLGLILALAGGFMDAYSYILRDEVFANAQTGNMLLFGINLSQGNWTMAQRYICPVGAFVIGIVISDIIRLLMEKKTSRRKVFHWRQVAVLIEIAVLAIVGFMPQDVNLLANSLTSLACGIQVESFRKIRGYASATTMCIGNLRSATQYFGNVLFRKDKASLEKGILFSMVILFFVIGAIIGNTCVGYFAERAIWIDVGILILASVMMLIGEVYSE